MKSKSLKFVLNVAIIIIILLFIGTIFLIKYNENTKKSNVKGLTKISQKNLPISNKNKDMIKKINTNSKQGKDKKIAYLTFDDGPSSDTTPKILAILGKYNIKATFFVIGGSVGIHPELIQRELTEGCMVENHTYSHNVDYLYSSPKNLVNDFQKNETLLKTIVPGYNSNLVRFPGGSRQRRKSYINAVKHAGYRIIDWNCLSGDAENLKYTVDDLVNNIKKTAENKTTLIVLMHDSGGRINTVQALPKIIDYLLSKGYTFKTL